MDYKIDHIKREDVTWQEYEKGKLVTKTRRPQRKLNPQSITIHSTGNPTSTALNERAWLTNKANNRVASYHIVVDDKIAVEVLPLNEVAYHAGNATGNDTSIGIEICESGDRAKTLLNAAQLTAKLLSERNWGIDQLKRHYDWSKKNCPRIMSANNWEGWQGFKMMVQRELDKTNNKVKVKVNGKIILVDGFMKDDVNYVPIRQILEPLGHKVGWDNKEKVVLVDD